MRRFLVMILAAAAVSLAPLLSATGANLEYEYALAAAALAIIVLPLAALLVPRRALPVEGDTYAPAYAAETFWIVVIGPALLALVPGIALATKACACSAAGFGTWFGLLVYPNWLLGNAAQQAMFRARAAGLSRRFLALVLAAVYLALALHAAWTLWYEPPKRLVNLLWGFIHGPIYDDWIAIDGGIIAARAAHVALAMIMLLLAWYQRRLVIFGGLVTATAAWAVTAALAAQYDSTKNSRAALDRLMNSQVAGDGFTLRYRRPQGAPDEGPAPLAIQRLARDAKFHIAELSKVLAPAPSSPAATEPSLPHVVIYVYPDSDRKKLWFGGGSTDVTDVHTPSVHITAEQWPHPTLRHELVHALASRVAFYGLGFHPNLALTEGLAVALAPTASAITLDDGAASLIKSGRIGDPSELFSPFGFLKASGPRAYTAAGSLLRYLIATKGMAAVTRLYGGASFANATGEDAGPVIAAWMAQITKSYDPSRSDLYADALYRHGGLFGERCPHSKADLARPRSEGPFSRIRQPIGWDPDSSLLPWLATVDPSDMDVQLRIWRREIRRVVGERFPQHDRLATWRQTLARGRHFPPESLEDVEAAIAESDLTRVLGDLEGSVGLLRDLSAAGGKRNFGESATREITARLTIESQITDQGQAIEWRRYLAGWRKIPEPALSAGPWLLSYLKLKNDREVRLTTAELLRLLREAPPDVSLPSTFHLEWYRLLASRLMAAGAYSDAAFAYSRAESVATPGARELYAEHTRRAQFYTGLGALTAAAE